MKRLWKILELVHSSSSYCVSGLTCGFTVGTGWTRTLSIVAIQLMIILNAETVIKLDVEYSR